MSDRGFIFKCVIVGDGGVGKTSLVAQFCEQKFSQQYIMTIGSNFALKLISSELLSTPEKKYPDVRLQLWDLAGQPHFRAVRHPFYKGSSAVIYVYDVTRPETLENLNGWRDEILKQCSEDIASVVLGNKIDLVDDRKVTAAQGEELAKNFGSSAHFETSAKDGLHVNDGFQILAKAIIDSLGEAELQ